MQQDEKDKVVNFAVEKLTGLIEPKTGKFAPILFKRSNLIKTLGLGERNNFIELSPKQLAQFINAAKADAGCWDLLISYIAADYSEGKEIPVKVIKFCLEHTTGLIERPASKGSKNTRDFIFLFLAEVISSKFKMNFSRNDESDIATHYSALDAIAEALVKIEHCKEKMQFSSLSRLRSKNAYVKQIVDNTVKSKIGYTKRNAKLV